MIENGILKADGVNGISNYEVAQVLGAGSLDVGTLCTHPNINKWSEDKPVALNATAEPNFKDTLKDIKELGYDMKNFQQGAYKKPYGVYPAKLTGIDSTGVGLPQSDVWEYVRLEKGQLTGNENKVVWATTNPDGQRVESERWARLSDFDGYNHLAIPPVKVEWLNALEITEEVYDPDNDVDKTVTKRIGGVYAKITVPKADSGSISFKNLLGVNSTKLQFIVVTNDGKYAYGSKSGLNSKDIITFETIDLVNGGECVLGIPNRVLSGLSGIFNFCIMAGEGVVIAYENGGEGWASGISYFYPKAQAGLFPNASDEKSGYIPEDGILNKQVNSLQGTTIFMTGGWDNKYGYARGKEGSVYPEAGFSLSNPHYLGLNYDNSAEVGKPYNNYPPLDGRYGMSIVSNTKMDTYMRGVIFKTASNVLGSVTSWDNYFQYCVARGTFYSGCKPLMNNLRVKMTNGLGSTYYGSVYVYISKPTDYADRQYLVQLICQITDAEGNIKGYNKIYEWRPESIVVGGTNFGEFVGQIGFYNITNNRGNVIGFRGILKYGYYTDSLDNASTREFDVYCDIEGDRYYPYIQPTSEDKGADIDISLPSNLPTFGGGSQVQQSKLGGQLALDYGIYTIEDIPFSYGDALNEDVLFT